MDGPKVNERETQSREDYNERTTKIIAKRQLLAKITRATIMSRWGMSRMNKGSWYYRYILMSTFGMKPNSTFGHFVFQKVL